MNKGSEGLGIGSPVYRRQPFIVETIRAYLEEALGTRTNRVKFPLLAPWDPDRFDWTCHPNPFSKKTGENQAETIESPDPLGACLESMRGGDVLRVVKGDPSLPYACPGGVPYRGVGGFTDKSIVYTAGKGYCDSWEWEPKLYDSYIIEAYLKGEYPVEIIVEWCPLGLVEQSGLEERIVYAARLARQIYSRGRGVKLTVLPGYALGSRHFDPLYWSSGAQYYFDTERLSGISSEITLQTYVVTGRSIHGDVEFIRIPFLYGGWVHGYRNGIPQGTVTPKASADETAVTLVSLNVSTLVEKLLGNLLDDALPLEARELLFHLKILVENKCTSTLRYLLPSILEPIYTPLGSGLEFLPEIKYYPMGGCEVYSLESGRRMYPCDKRLRYEALVRYVGILKEKVIEAEELLCK